MRKLKFLFSLLMLLCFSVGTWAADPTSVTINFGTTTGYWAAHTNASYTDSDSRSWTRTCTVSNMSGQAAYSQFGNASNTPDVELYATAGSNINVSAFSVKMNGASGGASPTTGTIYLYKRPAVGADVELATASVDGTNAVECKITSTVSFASTDKFVVAYDGINKAIRVTELKYTYTAASSGPTVSIEKNGSAITELDFGEHEPAAGYTSLTFDLKASNLTDGVYLESSNMAQFKIAADNYPNGLVYMTVNPTDGVIDTTITILASTLTSGTYDDELSITSTKSTPEFSDMSLGLKLKVLGPEIILKNNSTLDPMDDVDFGNVGKYQSRSAQFAFSYKRLQEGTLTITVSDDFTFSGSSQTETYEITSASGTTTYVSIYKNTQTVKNITDGWIKFTGCGLPSSGVLYDVKMNVKNPVVSIDITSTQDDPYDFGNIKQHTSCSSCSGSEYERKTIHIQGQYLANDLFTGQTGSVFNIYPSRIYIDDDGSVDQDLDVDIYTGVAGTFAYDRYDDTKNWKMRIYSGAVTPEFEEIEIYPSVTIVPTYSVQAYSSWETGLVSVNGSTPNSYGTAYVEDNTEEVTITAIPNLGYAFSHWDADVWASNCTIADEYSATTTVTATAATQIRAWFTSVCNPLTYPRDPEVADKTYNSAELAWGWVKFDPEDPSTKLATYKVKVTEVGTDNVIIEDVSFTSADLAYTMASTIVTGLKANTDYKFVVWATTNASGYCEDGEESVEVEFTTNPYPSATLTLSENGTESSFGSNLKVADVVTLPSTVTKGVVDKVLVGWSSLEIATPTDTKPGAATFWDKGASYVIQSTADKLYAVYATATPGTPTNHDLGTATLKGTATGGNSASDGYSVELSSTSNKDGYIQDNGTADVATVAIKLYVTNSETQIISSQPSAIKVVASLGGGSAKSELGHNVYAVLLDNSNNPLGDPVVLTTSIAGMSGTNYTASLPIANYSDVRGVKVYHLKENGYNVRYYSFSLKYETGGEYVYSGYVTQGARVLDNPTFSPAAGTYTTAQNITISATEGDIHYTINGADPTSASAEYTAAIALDEYGTYTIKAKAIDGDNASEVASSTYFMNLPFASLQDLVDANLPATGTEDVTVSFSSIAIDSIKNSSKSVYLHVLADGKGIYIYNGAAACPTTWEVDGRLSGTITGKWIKFNDKEWEIVPNSGFAWTDLTYTQASVSATPNTLNLGSIKQNFGELSKTFTLSGEGVTKSVKLTTNSIRLSVSPSVVSATDVLAGKEITVTGTSSWSGDQEYTVSVATEEAPYEVVANNLVTVSWSVTPTNIVYVTTNNTAYGTVKINSSTLGQWAVTATEEFTLDATALSGYEFDKWTTDDDSKVTIADINDASTTAVATGSVTITANFKKIPVGVLTLSKNVIDFGIVKKGTSVESQVFTLSGSGFTPGNKIKLSFTDTNDYYGLISNEYTANSEGKISELYVEVLVDNTATASYGSKDCSLKISGDDLASDSIVAIKLTVGEEIVVPTITGGSLTWDGGVAPSVAVVGSEHTLAAVPASGYTGGEIAILKAEDDSDVTDDVMSGSTLTVPGYAIKVVVSGFEATAHPSGLGWRYGGEDVTTHAHKFGTSTERFYFPSLKNPNEIDLDDIEFISSDSTVAEFGNRSHESSSWFAAVWVKKAGTAVMTARLKNHATYDDIEVSYTLTVSKGDLTDTQFRWFQYPDIYSPESDTYTWYESHSWPYINASSTYVDKNTEVTYESSNTDVATISSTGTITPVAVGSTIIKAKFIGNDMFNAKTVQFTLNVQKASPVLTWSGNFTGSSYTFTYGESYPSDIPHFNSVNPSGLYDEVKFSSSNTAVATVNNDGGSVSYRNHGGTSTIRAYIEETAYTNAAEISYDLTVIPKVQLVRSGASAVTMVGQDAQYKDYAATIALTKATHYLYIKINNQNLQKGVTLTRTNTSAHIDAYYGTEIAINADVAGDYTFTWNNNDSILSVVFPDIPKHTVTLGAHYNVDVVIKHNGVAITDGDEFEEGTVLTVEATVADGYKYNNKLDYIKVNGVDITTTKQFTVGEEDVVVTAAITLKTWVDLTWSTSSTTVKIAAENEYPTLTVSPANVPEIVVKYRSTNTAVATIDQNTGVITLIGVGSTVILAESDTTAEYRHGEGSYTLYVEERAEPGIGWSSTADVEVYMDHSNTYTLPTVVNPHNLAVTFRSSNTNVATIDDNGVITIQPGADLSTLIQVKYAGDNDYKPATVSFTLKAYAPDHILISEWSSHQVSYDYGDEFNFNAYKATMYYTNNGHSRVITDEATWTTEPATITADGNITVKATYAGVTGTTTANVEVKTYIVSINSKITHGAVVVKHNGVEINSGDRFVKGTELTVEVVPESGYELKKLSVMNTQTAISTEISEGTFIVGTEHISFNATFQPTEPTALDEAEAEHQVRKVLIDDKLFIIRDGKMFDASGALVK